MAGINVTVRAANASPGTGALATLYSDDGVTTTTNPVVTDATGTFGFYVADGRYDLTYSGTGFTTKIIAAIEIADVTEAKPSDAGWFTTRLNGVRFADQFASVQAAMDDLPVSGGTVFVKPGTYTGPTTWRSGVWVVNQLNEAAQAPPVLWSKFNGVAYNSFLPGVGSANMVQFNYTANLTIQDVSQIAIRGIVMDFAGSFNMKLQAVQHSDFSMAVVSTGTSAPALTIDGDGATGFSFAQNKFGQLILEGGNCGLQIGNNTPGGRIPSENVFDWIHILVDTQPAGVYTAVNFVGNCDSNIFHKIEVWGTTAITSYKGLVFNSASAVANTGADNIYVGWYDEVFAGFPGGTTSIVINPSFGNFIRTGVLTGATKLSVTAWANSSTYTWDRLGETTGSFANQNQFLAAQIISNGGTPSYLWQKLGVTKWNLIDSASDVMQWLNASTANAMQLDQSGNLTASAAVKGTTLQATAATPTVGAGIVGLGTTAGFGAGAAGTAVTTTTKGAGTGPTTPQTVVNYIKINIAGTDYWIPLVQ